MRRKSFAQNGEDLLLEKLFRFIGPTNKVAVEFGALDGLYHSNTQRFQRDGWRVLYFDITPLSKRVIHAHITAENINELFASHNVPHDLDVLSIDIDGVDLWVWRALRFQPRVVLIEYNGRFGPTESKTVPYEPNRHWDGTDYYGASVRALYLLGRQKGYNLLASTRTNLLFVRQDLVAKCITPDLVRLPAHGKPHDPLHRPWVDYP